MKIETLERHIADIDNTLKKQDDDYKKLCENHTREYNIVIREVSTHVATGAACLIDLRYALMEELKAKRAKKFWQFWK